MRGLVHVLGFVAVIVAAVTVVRRFRLAGRLGMIVLAVAVGLFLLAAAAAIAVPYLADLL